MSGPADHSYLLSDPTTGGPLALMEARLFTAIRAGAASAVAARHLARPDSREVACFGAGIQARFQRLCLRAVLPLAEVRVVGRDPQRAAGFGERPRRELGIAVEALTDRRAAVSGADLSRALPPHRDRSSPAGNWLPAPTWMPSGLSAPPPVRWIR